MILLLLYAFLLLIELLCAEQDVKMVAAINNKDILRIDYLKSE
jgi:hypothetical protein